MLQHCLTAVNMVGPEFITDACRSCQNVLTRKNGILL